MPRSVSRTTSYRILRGKTVVFTATFKGTQGHVGTFIRFTDLILPAGLPYAVYQFQGTIKLQARSQTRFWKFALVRSTGTVLDRYWARE